LKYFNKTRKTSWAFCVCFYCAPLSRWHDLVFYACRKWLVEDLSLQNTWDTYVQLLPALHWAIITLI